MAAGSLEVERAGAAATVARKQAGASSAGRAMGAGVIFALHGSVGNAAVQRLVSLQRGCSCGTCGNCGGGSKDESEPAAQAPVQRDDDDPNANPPADPTATQDPGFGDNGGSGSDAGAGGGETPPAAPTGGGDTGESGATDVANQGGSGDPGTTQNAVGDQTAESADPAGLGGNGSSGADPLGTGAAGCPASPAPKITPANKAVGGKTPKEFETALGSVGGAAGCCEITNHSWTSSTNSAGNVHCAVTTLEMATHGVTWTDPGATAADKKLIQDYVNLINAHEDRHAAIYKSKLNNIEPSMEGKSQADAQKVFDDALCKAQHDQEALDAKEGQIQFGPNYTTPFLSGVTATYPCP